MEYGDVRLIGENNLKEDNGGFLVGRFKMTVQIQRGSCVDG